MKNLTVVVFGIFDGVHEGHRHLFREASQHGSVVAIVGRDTSCLELKGKVPAHKERERVEMVKKEELVQDAVLGDEEISSYKVLEKLNPDSICLGYDQDLLEEDVARWALRTQRDLRIVRASLRRP